MGTEGKPGEHGCDTMFIKVGKFPSEYQPFQTVDIACTEDIESQNVRNLFSAYMKLVGRLTILEATDDTCDVTGGVS